MLWYEQVTTEDGQALDTEAAVQGLTLRLAPPSSGRANEIVLSPVPGAASSWEHDIPVQDLQFLLPRPVVNVSQCHFSSAMVLQGRGAAWLWKLCNSIPNVDHNPCSTYLLM